MAYVTLGKRIAQRRSQLGISQEALAEAMEVTWNTVARWESDAVMPGAGMLQRLGEVLYVSPKWLMGMETGEPEIPGSNGFSQEEFSQGQLEQLEQILNARIDAQPEQKRKSLIARVSVVCAVICLLATIFTMARTQEKLDAYAKELDVLYKSYMELQNQLEGMQTELPVG